MANSSRLIIVTSVRARTRQWNTTTRTRQAKKDTLPTPTPVEDMEEELMTLTRQQQRYRRSDNFSAHLRTHTKKSAAAAAAAAAGTTTAHLRRFERQQQQQLAAAAEAGHEGGGGSMMIDPIRTNFPNSSMSALVSSGPLDDATHERRSGTSGGNGGSGGGGADYSHHRHSIAGYPSYSGGSRSPLQMQNIYSHGLPTPVSNHGPNNATTKSARNSYCGPSSSSEDPTSSSPANYDHHQQPPKSATPAPASSAFSFGLPSSGHQQQQHQQEQHRPQQKQQYHRRSPSSGMHPLDSPTTPTSATTPTNASFAAHGPTAAATAATGKPGTVDGMGSIVPKFNTIKLDLKSITNHPEELHPHPQQSRPQQYHHQQQRRFSSPGVYGDEDEDVEIKSPRSARQGSPSPYPYHHCQQQQQQQQQQHRHSSGSIHSGFKSEEHEDEDHEVLEQLPLRRRGSEQDRKSLPASTVTGYERPNSNPNGESPVLAPRGPVGARHGSEDDMEDEEDNGRSGKFGPSSMNFPALISSHFTPASAGNNVKNAGSSRQGSPAMRGAVAIDDVQDGGVMKSFNNNNNNNNGSSKGDGHGLSTSSSSSFVSVGRRPSSSTTPATNSVGANGAGPGRGGHEYASMSGSYQHLNGSVSPPRSNSDSYSGSVPMDEDGNPLHPQHRHSLSGYHHQHPQHHGGGYGDYDRVGGYPHSPRIHHHSSGSTSSSSFYPSGQQHSGPSSSSMNGYYNHSQFPAYHPQQYSMEDSGSYHHHGHHPHGMPPMPTTASFHQQQPQQQPQRSTGSGISSSNAMGGGGRVRGMTSSAKNHCCPVSGCMKRFKRLEHLKRHTKTHTLERPFACSTAGCNKRFSRSDNLSQHIKTHQRQSMNKIHWKQRSM
ncbi:hypothetical protein BGW39_007260 [Mortierella sp. 14UC]|nr:hypothetical protein BGW39_007260 [Mortierella sp. 14UC]